MLPVDLSDMILSINYFKQISRTTMSIELQPGISKHILMAGEGGALPQTGE